MITEPKRLFNKTLEPGENVIANTESTKWIISDLWLVNATESDRKLNLIIENEKPTGEKYRDTLLPNIELASNQTMIVGNLIVEPFENIVASAEFDPYSYLDLEHMRFISRSFGFSGNLISIEFSNPQKENEQLSHTLVGNALKIKLATNNVTVPTQASYTTNMAGANNDITITAKEKGISGNDISIEFIQAGNNTPLSTHVTVVEETPLTHHRKYHITVNLATNASGNITTNANLLRSSLIAGDSGKLINVELLRSDGNTGAGIVTPLELFNLAGGVDATITTTYNEILDYMQSVEEIDTLVETLFHRFDYTGGDIVPVFIATNLNHGTDNLYNATLLGRTGVSIVGYGRVVNA